MTSGANEFILSLASSGTVQYKHKTNTDNFETGLILFNKCCILQT